jgi:hypothetical protein
VDARLASERSPVPLRPKACPRARRLTIDQPSSGISATARGTSSEREAGLRRDIFGYGVNIAARLEGLAEPGGICVSARVQEDVAGRLDLIFEDMGEQLLKNIARRVRGTEWRQLLARPQRDRVLALPFPTSRRSRCCLSPI